MKFNLQLFADQVKTQNALKLGFQRSDETIQYISMVNPDNFLSEESVQSAMEYWTQHEVLLDSKTHEPFSDSAILTAYTEYKTTIELDLS